MEWDEDSEKPNDARSYLTFEVGAATFAVDVSQVSEILDPQPMLPIPGAPHVVRGMIDLRGRSIVCIFGPDLFDVPGSSDTEKQNERLVVFELANGGDGPEKATLAVRVDWVRAVEGFTPDQIDPPPGMAGPHVFGSAKRDGDTILFVSVANCLSGGLDQALFGNAPESLVLA